MSTAPAWEFADVMALAVEANGHLPPPLCDFTPEEASRLAVIEAAPEPEEIRVERVARAIYEADPEFEAAWHRQADSLRDLYRRLAIAAIAALESR